MSLQRSVASAGLTVCVGVAALEEQTRDPDVADHRRTVQRRQARGVGRVGVRAAVEQRRDRVR